MSDHESIFFNLIFNMNFIRSLILLFSVKVHQSGTDNVSQLRITHYPFEFYSAAKFSAAVPIVVALFLYAVS